MNIKQLLIATAVALTSLNAYATCTIRYNCGTGATGCPAQTTNSDSVSTLEITAASAPTRNGYVFAGWKTNRTGDTLYTPGDTISWTLANGKTCATITGPGITVTAQWGANFSVTYANGGGTGSAPSGPTSCTYGETCNAPENTYTAPGGGYIFTGWRCTKSNGISCGTFLPGASISNATFTDNDTITLTAQWVDGIPLKIPTSKSYVDSKMNALQPKFSGLGNSKLMTYGTTDGAVGSRDIVTELGTSTTANTVPTRGAILTGLNTKQDTINGTAGWVATNTGWAGRLTQKPIYSTTNRYKTALVDAQTLNNAVIDAVNSELIRVDETGEPNANGTLWKLNDLEHLTLLSTRDSLDVSSLDTSTGGTSFCYRGLNEKRNDNAECGTATLATLGAEGNQSGLWGAVMPYGDIVGKSVCSSQSGTYANAATDAQESALTTEFNAQFCVGTSALSNSQKYCWCKMESINGEPAVSRWVFYRSFSSASDCAADCASFCGGLVRGIIDFRVGVFGAVAQ